MKMLFNVGGGGGVQWRTQLLTAMAMGATATKMAIDSV
jgi:hypothetical protein